MCLSTVYEEINGERSKVCEYVSNVKSDGETYTMTDIMGVTYTVKGSLKSMDFIKNEIVIAGV